MEKNKNEIINIENLSFGYTEDIVVDNVNLKVNEADFVIITGENGSGKSTLLKLILGEIKPDKGKVVIAGKKNRASNDYGDVGYVPQVNAVNKISFPITCLELTVMNLASEFGWLSIPRQRHYDKAAEILKKMGLAHYIRAPFNELSGGLQQRVMIARAMIKNPRILILDEPTAGVDKESKTKFLGLIADLNKKEGVTVILVTHELETVVNVIDPDAIYSIESGEIKRV